MSIKRFKKVNCYLVEFVWSNPIIAYFLPFFKRYRGKKKMVLSKYILKFSIKKWMSIKDTYAIVTSKTNQILPEVCGLTFFSSSKRKKNQKKNSSTYVEVLGVWLGFCVWEPLLRLNLLYVEESSLESHPL